MASGTANATSAAVGTLEEAEEKIMSALESATSAFRSLAAADSTRVSPFDAHAESFLTDLAEAQKLIRSRISLLGPDLPFENGSMRSLIEADIALQATSLIHARLERCVRAAVPPSTETGGAVQAEEAQLADVIGELEDAGGSRLGGMGEGAGAPAINAADLGLFGGGAPGGMGGDDVGGGAGSTGGGSLMDLG